VFVLCSCSYHSSTRHCRKPRRSPRVMIQRGRPR
jgi:hypothetical protein